MRVSGRVPPRIFFGDDKFSYLDVTVTSYSASHDWFRGPAPRMCRCVRIREKWGREGSGCVLRGGGIWDRNRARGGRSRGRETMLRHTRLRSLAHTTPTTHAGNTTIRHTYATPHDRQGGWKVSVQGCCRIASVCVCVCVRACVRA